MLIEVKLFAIFQVLESSDTKALRDHYYWLVHANVLVTISNAYVFKSICHYLSVGSKILFCIFLVP